MDKTGVLLQELPEKSSNEEYMKGKKNFFNTDKNICFLAKYYIVLQPLIKDLLSNKRK